MFNEKENRAAYVKCHSNIKKVFELLSKDIDFSKTKTCALYTLGHPKFVKLFKDKYPNINFTIIESDEIKCIYRIPEKVFFVNITNDKNSFWPKELNDMKFDKIIMNPPYDGNLHLQILEELLQHSSHIVNLSPIRWLQDPLALYKQNSSFKKFENIRSQINRIDVIKGKNARDIFGAGMMIDLGIYYIDKENKSSFKSLMFSEEKLQSVFNKILNAKSHFDSVVEANKIDGIRVKIRQILPSGDNRSIKLSSCGITQNEEPIVNGKLQNGLNWQTLSGMNKNKENLPVSIKFNTINEANNFISSMKTSFMIYCYFLLFSDQHIFNFAIPWMGEEVNPRTGLKGYESEWIDEDFYRFFNITEEEQKVIEDTMKKYV